MLLVSITVFDMVAKDATFEFFEGLPREDKDIPEGVVAEMAAWKEDFDEHNGLLPAQTVAALLGVSQQRWGQLNAKYEFWSAKHFGKTWYSRRQIEDFYKLERKRGRPAHDVAKVLKTMVKPVNK